MLVKALLSDVPTLVTATTIARAISPITRAYSVALAPSSSTMNRLMNSISFDFSFWFFDFEFRFRLKTSQRGADPAGDYVVGLAQRAAHACDGEDDCQGNERDHDGVFGGVRRSLFVKCTKQ